MAETKKKGLFPRLVSWSIIGSKSLKFFKAFKAIKAVKAIKPLVTVGTMALSLLVYGWAFGWVFAVGLVAMIFIHEMGHVIALRQKGYPTKAPVFIPMLGAVVFAPADMNRKTEAYVGIGGPVLGTIGALAAWVIWMVHPEHPMLWLIMSYLGIFINLFNMLPIRPLDGGRVTQAVGEWFKWVGLGGLLLLTVFLRDPGLLLIWILVIDDLDKLPIKRRFHYSLTVYIIMILAVFFGLGEGNLFVHLFDIGFATFIVFVFWIRSSKLSDEEMKEMEDAYRKEGGSDRPGLEMKSRFGWFMKYAALTALLVVVLGIQSAQIQPWLEEQKAKDPDIEEGLNRPQISESAPYTPSLHPKQNPALRGLFIKVI